MTFKLGAFVDADRLIDLQTSVDLAALSVTSETWGGHRLFTISAAVAVLVDALDDEVVAEEEADREGWG